MKSKSSTGLVHKAGDETEPGFPEENPLPDLELDWDEESIRSLIDLTPFFQLWYVSLVLEVLIIFVGYIRCRLIVRRISLCFVIPPYQVSGENLCNIREVFLANA